MGKGRDLARELDPSAPHHQVLEDLKDQLVIAMLRRLADQAGVFEIPVAEVDDTGRVLVMFSVVPTPAGQVFHFEVRKKQ